MSVAVQILNPVTEDCVLAGQADRLHSGRRGVLKYQLVGEKFSEELEDASYQVRHISSLRL